MAGSPGSGGSGFSNPVNPNGTGAGIPFMSAMPKNLIAPTFGEQIYNPSVGAQMGTNISPFFGPNNTLSGQFGKFLQPGYPDPTAPPPPAPPPGTRPTILDAFSFPSSGRFTLPEGADADWKPENLPSDLAIYQAGGFGYLVPQTSPLGLPNIQPWNAESPPTYDWGQTPLDASGLPKRKPLTRSIRQDPEYADDYTKAQHKILAQNLLGLYGGSYF